MAAEANNRGGINDDLALGYLNQVRIRAFDDDEFELNNLTGSNLTEAIWEERKFELAMEGHRFFDLTRFGVYDEYCRLIYGNTDGARQADDYLWPIPITELSTNSMID